MKRFIGFIIIIIVSIGAAFAVKAFLFSANTQNSSHTDPDPTPPAPTTENIVREELSTMTLDEKIAQIKHYNLQRIFDDLYDYYFEYSRDEVKAIQEAYDIIFNFRINVITDQLLNELAIYIFKHIKGSKNDRIDEM